MPEEPEQTSVPEPEVQTEAPPPEPTPPEPEEDPVPQWLYAQPPQPTFSQPFPQAPPMPPPPQMQPPPPQYRPPNQIPLEELVSRPRDVISGVADEAVMNRLAPVLGRLMEVDNFTRVQHVANVQRMDSQAREAIAEGYKGVAKDPGFKDRNVRQVFDNVVAGYLSRARQMAANGDFTGMYQFQNPKFLKAAMELSKVHAGYTNPEPISVRGGGTESSRSAPPAAITELDRDMEDAARDLANRTGRPVEEIRKKMLSSLDQRRKERWS